MRGWSSPANKAFASGSRLHIVDAKRKNSESLANIGKIRF
ncbi:hypothetical protein BURMUCF1_1660 [Burkholderia multivorans ATCC BAA-247]|uniref:Uncharacterized protein n=1 Tax=Burkholderia multivorans CGD2 TaxID=513052 RepID=B9BM00_9BURK|nr:conserved hypothetical protein [Burkholderia multivorans CGD2]EEE14402.1 conserved hypothetical protein [Burkholderia multivorans CGD2M]EJO58644.1 hypothetical protein BURMUCF1_1660 [Burkholderia multivorans ATCC BAA-247]